MTDQPLYHSTRASKRERTETFDRTHLREDRDGQRVHRDYAAHYFRWGWATRWFYNKDLQVLDVGCGPDMALANLTNYRSRQPGTLVCVDLNSLDSKKWIGNQKWVHKHGEMDFTKIENQRELWRLYGPFDVIVCFEVIEHMIPEKGDELLLGIKRLLKDDGYALLSTPVFDGHRAANHIHEYEIPELQEKIERAGLVVEKRYGTFASFNDVKKGIDEWFATNAPEGLEPFKKLYEELREFHSDDVLSTFLAPVMPDRSRNNAWKLRKAG